jgi:hypothetical protein
MNAAHLSFLRVVHIPNVKIAKHKTTNARAKSAPKRTRFIELCGFLNFSAHSPVDLLRELAFLNGALRILTAIGLGKFDQGLYITLILFARNN